MPKSKKRPKVTLDSSKTTNPSTPYKKLNNEKNDDIYPVRRKFSGPIVSLGDEVDPNLGKMSCAS